MPDVSRSNSQRSDASQKPRVSFNRDVHVKRIGREGVISALAGDGEGHLIPLPVRRERPSRLSREDLEKEAETILRQAERINCIPSTGPGKFSTLPPRPKKKQGPPAVTSIFNSLDRRNKKKKNITQANEVFQEKNEKNNRIDDEKLGKRRYSNPDIESQRVEIIIPPLSGGKSINNRVKRSVSDVGNRNDRISIFATLDRIKKNKENKRKLDKLVTSDELKMNENHNNANNNSNNKNYNKKQLSPIMEKDSPQIAELNKSRSSPFKFEKSKNNNDKNNNSGGDNRKDVGKEAEEEKRRRERERDEEVRGVNTATPTVVYAEVVSKPGLSKHTVHKAVVQEHASTTQHNQLDTENEDVADMGHRTTQNRRYSYDGEIPHKPKEFTVDIVREGDYPSKYKTSDEEPPEERIINMIRAKSNPLLDNENYVGGYRREVRTERVIRIEGAEEPDGRGRADGMDYNGRRRESRDYYENEHVVKRNHANNFDRHDLDKFKKSESIFNQSLDIDCNDMSLRRDRLQERLGKSIRRYTSAANESSSYRDDKLRKNAARKEFLMSQIDGENNNNNKERYFETKIVTEIDKHRQQVSRSKEVLADSGIEMNEHRKYTKKEHVATMNRRNKEINKTDSRSKSTPSLTRIDYDHSDVERKDYKNNSNDLSSTKLIKEHKHKNDVLPTSSALVKNYSKNNEDEPKEVSKQDKSTKKNEKPEKEKKKEKLSRMDKVKRLMFGSKDSKKKKKKKQEEEEQLEEQLRVRYTEYKGSDVSATSSPVSPKRRQTSSSDVEDKTDQEHEYYGSRQRLATPSPRPSEKNRNKQDEAWFKSLTRKNKHKAEKKSKQQYSPVDNGDESVHSYHNGSNKHLRFFGDTDQESIKSQHVDPPPHSRAHSQTSNNRHRRSSPSDSNSNTNHLQVPSSNTPVRSLKKKRHSIHDSSAESTTEGDSSQHSQKSVVYLHATTVGDIPGSKKLHRSMLGGGRKALSREELSSNNEVITPQTRTLSRSISVLAPWRPRHNRNEIHYDDAGKPPKPPKQSKQFNKHGEIKENQKPEKKDKRYSSKSSSRKGMQELRKSKENLDDYRNDSPHRNGSDSTTRERKNRDNFVFVGKRESRDEVDNSDREKRYRRYENGSSTINRKYRSSLDTSRATAKSTETLGRLHHKEKPTRDLSRSMTMPKDSRLTSGWYKDKSNKVK